ncbi:Aminotransferase class V domain [Dillenia turbinata]|uniref:Aminotransferase class V domain n=1 Tax=Dillenia turbinata TaxID=194707 RepID=A0AAN8V2D0_9MAGN
MKSCCIGEASFACLEGCFRQPPICFPEQHASNLRSTSSSACRRDFAAKTASTFFPNIQFTNHESLPSLQESFIEFNQAYPEYSQTNKADQIRAEEYYHLSISNHVCLDYIGVGLLSHHQLQIRESCLNSTTSTSSQPPVSPPRNLDLPFFSISYKSVNLKLQLLHGSHASGLEQAIKKKIMSFLNISENDYSMVFTANRTSAFKLLAESYPFQANQKLLTVYDYESEAIETMLESSQKRGGKVMSAEFSWPRLRIQSAKLRKMLVSKRKKKMGGLFVFPIQSRVTGARYPYLWMSVAQENGWHVLLDACALGPKDMDTFALSIFRPDFLICSFYKIFGENPSGLGCLFVKKSTVPILEASKSTGIVSIHPERKLFKLPSESSGTDADHERKSGVVQHEDDLDTSSSFSGPISIQMAQSGISERGEASERHEKEMNIKQKGIETSGNEEAEKSKNSEKTGNARVSEYGSLEIECRGLDHVDSLGLIHISNRTRCLINWLVNALMKLQHPNTEKGAAMVRIYGPKIKFDRGAAIAFNLYDWKGEKVEPILIQKLADRNNISLSYGFLHHIWFSDKYTEKKEKVLEKRAFEAKEAGGNKTREKADMGITVVTAALGFLTNFEDIYRLWAFVAQFLDADFVEKERWRYTALNQKMIEV